MGLDEAGESTKMRPQGDQLGEARMVDQERWAEIRRLFHEKRVSIAEIGRRLDVDRKTVRRSLRQARWKPYHRAAVAATLLTAHADFVRDRAPQVNYSARILYQELRGNRGYTGSYETVTRFIAPLREVPRQADRALLRFETPPGQQSQIDWGQARVSFRTGSLIVHVFVLTVGFSRRGFYHACADERLAQFLEAHERAFAHFGGHTREHLYDRPRTVCYADETGRRLWNPTFKAFADYWGVEPRVCRPYRAQTKGQVESGVKDVKRNFLPGRTFVDLVDFQTQLDEWNATIADCRLHGTTHEAADRAVFSGTRTAGPFGGAARLPAGGPRLAHRGRGLLGQSGDEPLLRALPPHRPAGRGATTGRHGAHLPSRPSGCHPSRGTRPPPIPHPARARPRGHRAHGTPASVDAERATHSLGGAAGGRGA